ncbi:MAG: ComF family protein [Ignavibacteria bacterium]|nr:ComF family protein [Ignavibacteria bacterium]
MVTPATVFAWCKQVADALDDCLFPPHCILSGKPLSENDIHVARIPGILNSALDAVLAAPNSIELLSLIEKHSTSDAVFISQVSSLWRLDVESDIDKAIYEIKYRGRVQLAKNLGHELGIYLREYVYSRTELSEMLIQPVPIHSARLRERGYNQALHISAGVAKGLGLAPERVVSLLRRTKYTGTQTALSEKQRIENVGGVFEGVNAATILGKHVLVIDDVLTTGSTLNACATALVESGASRADAATLCMAI